MLNIKDLYEKNDIVMLSKDCYMLEEKFLIDKEFMYKTIRMNDYSLIKQNTIILIIKNPDDVFYNIICLNNIYKFKKFFVFIRDLERNSFKLNK